ncbi:MAG: hypothetical protein KAI66_25875, partial [Lentisphaeria bacterium]|nr:hypothetical protein [Lentisphaeria bacterium]
IAVVFSAKTPKFMDVYHGPMLNNNLIKFMFYPEFFKIGAPFDVYLTSDLDHPDFPKEQYKLIIMMNPFYLASGERAAIKKLQADGRTFLWFYAPGYVDDEKGLTVDGIRDITGIEVAELAGKECPRATLNPIKHPLVKELPKSQVFASAAFTYPATVAMHSAEYGPVFRITDDNAVAIASFADGRTAIAARAFASWKSVYSIIPRLDVAFLQNVCDWAGVHIYCRDRLPFDANRNYVVVGNGYEQARDIAIELPRTTAVTDAVTGKNLPQQDRTIRITLQPAETKVLHME